MAAIGGPPRSISIAGRDFSIISDADVGRQLGGVINERQQNGDGTSRLIKTPTSWKLTGCQIEIDNTRKDQEFLQDVNDSSDDVPISIEYNDDTIYYGDGNIEGEMAYTNNNAAASIDLSGEGALKQ